MTRLRGAVELGLTLVAAGSAAACAEQRADAPQEDGVAYLGDASFRREAMTASLVNPDNGYSRLRLAHYASGTADDWDALPEWNPAVAPVLVGELDGAAGAAASTLPLNIDVRDEAALHALGEAAFFAYPVQLAPRDEAALASRATLASYGFWIDDGGRVGGLVRVALDGGPTLALTCATCHAHAQPDGSLTVGLGNARLDLGALAADTSPADDPRTAAALTWGPGRVDVTTSEGTEPVRIPDLRPVRFLTHLHHDATLLQRDQIALAIRLETLVITSHGLSIRPPRVIALALASYLWSLADSLPEPSPATDAQQRGAALFTSACAECHAPPSFTGPPVPIDDVGTEPTVGRSLDRGTGYYRVPSLRGVAARPLLLHDASLSSLDSLLDPARTVPGHRYGLDLDAPARADLLAYLQTL